MSKTSTPLITKPKILITGTGRCGTTFLIKLFTFLEFDTGYTKENYMESIYKNCNSGMEKKITEDYYITKDPEFLEQIDKIITNSDISIKQIIIPIRDYTLSAKSRVFHNNEAGLSNESNKIPGGLRNARNEEEQIQFYNNLISNYVFNMVKYNINTLFLDFDKMVNDKQYLFEKLKHILDEKKISFETFSKTYDEVSETSKPKKLLLYEKLKDILHDKSVDFELFSNIYDGVFDISKYKT